VLVRGSLCRRHDDWAILDAASGRLIQGCYNLRPSGLVCGSRDSSLRVVQFLHWSIGVIPSRLHASFVLVQLCRVLDWDFFVRGFVVSFSHRLAPSCSSIFTGLEGIFMGPSTVLIQGGGLPGRGRFLFFLGLWQKVWPRASDPGPLRSRILKGNQGFNKNISPGGIGVWKRINWIFYRTIKLWARPWPGKTRAMVRIGSRRGARGILGDSGGRKSKTQTSPSNLQNRLRGWLFPPGRVFQIQRGPGPAPGNWRGLPMDGLIHLRAAHAGTTLDRIKIGPHVFRASEPSRSKGGCIALLQAGSETCGARGLRELTVSWGLGRWGNPRRLWA